MDEQPQEDIEELKRRYKLLNTAHEARGRLLAKQRWEFAERLQDEVEERDRELERLRAEVQGLEQELEGKQGELDRLARTKVLRYTAPIRGLWSRVRRRA
jgi:hypothetical protein